MHQDTFKGSLLACSENVSDTALTVVCTINVLIKKTKIHCVLLSHELLSKKIKLHINLHILFIIYFKTISKMQIMKIQQVHQDAMTHKSLDHETQKINYRSAVRPKKSSTPYRRLAPHGGEVSASSNPSEDKISSGLPLQYSQIQAYGALECPHISLCL